MCKRGSRHGFVQGNTWVIGVGISVVALSGVAEAVEKASEQVVPFYGSFAYSIPLATPAFHGLEPRIALAYSSEGRNGLVGVGWSLTGFNTIERANKGRGTPRFDANDIYLLDGQELVACIQGSASPSCTTGGTHSTKIESYLKIRFDSGSNTWTVWGRDGTRTVFSPTVQVTAGTFRWGQTSVVDTKGNTVTYTWNCTGGDCYPGQIDYNSYRVTFYLESRPDTFSGAAYSQLIQTLYRVRSVLVNLVGVSPIRAYKLSYATSALTNRSLLASAQQYGKDVTIDGAGAITGGTSLPAQTFTYQNDSLGKSFQGEAPNPPTPPGTLENVVWANRINAYAVSPGNSLQKSINTTAWDAGASSNRAIASGDGYTEFAANSSAAEMVGLSNGDTDASPQDIDFAAYDYYGTLYAYENGVTYGPFGSVATGELLRVEVQGGVVRYKKAGATYYTSNHTPTYPLLVDTGIYTGLGVINSVVLSGSLQDANFWCQGALLLTGDFNGDGRTDQLCYRSETQTTQVELATATGFAAPVTWLSGYGFMLPVVGDFNADGKADIADGPDWDGHFYVVLSTGAAFGAPALWATANPVFGTDRYGNTISGACRMTPVVTGTGDFNGDGITDISCRIPGSGYIYIGLSNGSSSFSFSIFASLSCDTYEQTGAIDFDGDGKDDWYCIGISNNLMLVFPSTGSTFVWPAFGQLDGTFCDQPHYVLGDFNGDGRTDAACLTNGKVALSTGYFFVQSGTFGGWCTGATNFFAADVDGDGASEIVCNNGGAIQVRKWTGGALGAVETWKQSWCGTSVGGGDFNGDGKTDLLCNSQTTPVALAGTGGYRADLVSVVGNGLGGTTQATYAAATNYPSTNVTKQVVATVTINDGRGAPAMTSYIYSGGLMDPKERRFLGFRTAKESPPCAPGASTCPFVFTMLRQDLPSAGKIERVDRGSEGQNVSTIYLTTPTCQHR